MKTQVKVERVFEVENAPPRVSIGEIVKLNPDGKKLLKNLNKLTITPIKSQDECDDANTGIGKLKKLLNYLIKIKLEYTASWRTATQEANKIFDIETESLEKAIKQGATTVFVWDDKQLRLQHEAEEKAREEQEAAEDAAKKKEAANRKRSLTLGGDGNVAPVVAAPVQKIVPYKATMSTSYRKNWGYEVTNFGVVPDRFKIIDGQILKAAMDKDKDGDPTAVIPGIKWVNNPTRVR